MTVHMLTDSLEKFGINLQNRTFAHPTTQSSTPGRYPVSHSPTRTHQDTRPLTGDGIDR